jgi:His-Xaa-Ser system protein HxsD
MKEPEVIALSPKEGVTVLALDKGLYPLDVVYGAAYVLTDRAYLLLDKDAKGRILVRIESKDEATEAELRALVGEFSNELLSQALRRKVTQQNKAILEAIVTQAIAGATGAMVPGAMEDEDDDLDFLDDPLGIAVPWEEKFSKEAKKKETTATPTSDGVAGPGDSGGHKPTSGGGKA